MKKLILIYKIKDIKLIKNQNLNIDIKKRNDIFDIYHIHIN